MKLNTIPARPFIEGIIRVASTNDPATDRLKYSNTIEVLSRHHEPRSEEDGSIPTLARHAITDQLIENRPANKEAGKVVEVPIRMFYNKAANSLGIAYQAYNEVGHPICRGDGENAIRWQVAADSVTQVAATVPCAGAESCPFAATQGVRCRRQVGMTVQIAGQSNPLSAYEVRSSSYNAYKTLKGQLEMIEKRFKGLRHVPLKLKLWQASNQASEYESFDVFMLDLDAASEIDAMKAAQSIRNEEAEAGLEADIDAAFVGVDNDMPGMAEQDFALVQDFYRPVPGTGRREGTASVAVELTTRNESGDATSYAHNLLTKALQSAGCGQEAAASTSP